MATNDTTTFTIEATVQTRWVPHFLAMLRYMQHLGAWGGSRLVTIMSDGDGDFRPQFRWDANLPEDGKPIIDKNGHRTYDAG